MKTLLIRDGTWLSIYGPVVYLGLVAIAIPAWRWGIGPWLAAEGTITAPPVDLW